MKKIMAITLAVLVLIFSLSIATGAAGTGTITVNGAEQGATYTLYKIFDITGSGDELSYTVPTGMSASLDSQLFDSVDNGGKIYVSPKSGKDAEIIAWAKANKGSLVNVGSASPAENADKVTFTGLDAGYYYIDSTVSNGGQAIITKANPSATVVEKNSTPGWGDNGGKVANSADKTYSVGETITYTVTYENATNFENGKKITAYTVSDTGFTGGVLDADSVNVTVNDAPLVQDVTNLTATGNTLSFNIPWAATSDLTIDDFYYKSVPAKIVITYDVKVTSTVTVAAELTNKITIDPVYDGSTPDDPGKEEKVYTGSITINKTGENSTKLGGATFIVCDTANEGAGVKYLVRGADGWTWSETKADAEKFITVDGTGDVTIPGLKAGTYYLVETEAPAGYVPKQGTTAVTIVAADSAATAANMAVTTTINNTKAGAMPETGGIGTTLFYVLGSILFIGGAIALIAKKRMGSKN
jgi:fimbrial isopeptide formation D2 family protein/LPXTG-motif cell wall-anchored protein